MSTERQTHRTIETGDIFCGDGYDWLEAAEKKGWKSIASWGRDGWDMGGWPLVSFSWRERPDGLWDAVQHVEGDLTILEGATVAERDAWLDVKACWHWLAGQSDGPVKTHVDADGNPTEHQNWEHRINIVRVELQKHLMTTEFAGTFGEPGYGPIGHMLYGIDIGPIPGVTLWDIHEAMHAQKALREGRTVTNDELVDWMDPDWRGPYSRARSDA